VAIRDALKEQIETGNSHVLALITALEEDRVTAVVQGHAFNSRQVQASTTKVQPVVSLST
jgi:uncharacterized protein (DUF1786 family)